MHIHTDAVEKEGRLFSKTKQIIIKVPTDKSNIDILCPKIKPVNTQ